MTRILVTGSRDWADEETIRSALHAEWGRLGFDPAAVLVHGGARGADEIARRTWLSWGMSVEAHEARWKLYGRAAGVIRNSQMVAAGADVCLAFPLPGSRGTWDCVEQAREAGIPVRVFSAKDRRVE